MLMIKVANEVPHLCREGRTKARLDLREPELCGFLTPHPD